jgi:uncharacterized repeat protein (TIGR01451 family)
MKSNVRRLAPAAVIGLTVVAMGLLTASSAVPAPGDTANLRVVKSDNPDPVVENALLTYKIEVTNLGPQGATGTTVTDTLPPNVDFVSATSTQGTCNRQARRVTCNVGNLAASGAGATETITIVVRPRRDGTITNTAEVDSVENDPVAANNEDSESTRVNEPATPPQQASCRGVTATIKGTGGNDTLTGTGGRDVVAAFAGDDQIAAFAAQDLVCAGRGNDYVGGGSAADRVFGGPGRDRLLGRGGPDLLAGNAGNDVLKGNRGSDRLRGGTGFDRCRGGAGADSRRGCES